jgi:hypothetical protein
MVGHITRNGETRSAYTVLVERCFDKLLLLHSTGVYTFFKHLLCDILYVVGFDVNLLRNIWLSIFVLLQNYSLHMYRLFVKYTYTTSKNSRCYGERG